MKRVHSQHRHRLLAPAARAARRFASRRLAHGQYGAWFPMALFWRRQRERTVGVRIAPAARASEAVWLPSFHLHFMTYIHDRPWREAMPGSLPVAAIYQRRVVMDGGRTVVQSRLASPQPGREQHPNRFYFGRQTLSGPGVNAQATSPNARSVRRPIAPPDVISARRPIAPSDARSDWQPTVTPDMRSAWQSIAPPDAYPPRRTIALPDGILARRPVGPRDVRSDWQPTAIPDTRSDGQTIAPPNARQARRPLAPADLISARHPLTRPNAISARRLNVLPTATWTADRDVFRNLKQPQARTRRGTVAPTQTILTLRTSMHELLVFRAQSTASGDTTPRLTRGSIAPQTYFHQEELVWRRAVLPAAGSAGDERQAGAREHGPQPLDRSLPVLGVSPGMPPAFGHVPAAPALKIDTALMERLADDVIRRVERRERIERARRGL